jgi:hypothetical protein
MDFVFLIVSIMLVQILTSNKLVVSISLKDEIMDNITMDTLTIQNPTTGDTWVSGNRGKPPKWVASHPKYIQWKSNKSTPSVQIITTPVQTLNVLKFWKFGSNNREFKSNVTCIVGAFSELEAIQLLNKTFKNPVTANEFSSLWTPTEIKEITTPGVYQRTDLDWVIRPTIK